MAQGIDVYRKFQGSINWASVKAAGITVAWAKATNGNAVVDSTASPDPYVSGCKANGIKVGLYNYCTATAGGSANAATLASEVKRLQAFDLAPLIDYEDASLPQTQAGAKSYIAAYCSTLAANGITAAYLYMPGSWWAAFGWFAGAATIVTNGVTLIATDAEYGVNDGTEHPRTHYTAPIGVHQYTSVGSVSGVTGNVDRDNVTIVLGATGGNVVLGQDDIDAIVNAIFTKQWTRTNPTYDGVTVLTGVNTLEGIVERYDNTQQVLVARGAQTDQHVTAQLASISSQITAVRSEVDTQAGLTRTEVDTQATATQSDITAAEADLDTRVQAVNDLATQISAAVAALPTQASGTADGLTDAQVTALANDVATQFSAALPANWTLHVNVAADPTTPPAPAA